MEGNGEGKGKREEVVGMRGGDGGKGMRGGEETGDEKDGGGWRGMRRRDGEEGGCVKGGGGRLREG